MDGRSYRIWVSLLPLILHGASAEESSQATDLADRGAGARQEITRSWSDVNNVCVTPNPAVSYARSVQHSCRVVGQQRLGAVDDTTWFVIRYRRMWTAIVDGSNDSVSYDELVLAGRVREEPRAAIRWHVRRDRSIEFLDTLQWTTTAHGVIAHIVMCLNGTGGCSDEYLLRRSGSWHAVRQAFVMELGRRLPPGHQLHKGQRIDLGTMTGVWPVARDGDGNCCPSREIPFQLRWNDSTLELVSAGPLRQSGRTAPGYAK